MSTYLVRRQERRPPPAMPRGEILLEPPPDIPETQSNGFQATMMYLPMAAMGGMMGLSMLSGGTSNPLSMVSSGGMGLAMVAMMVGQMGRGTGDRKQKLNGERRDYFRYLSQVRKRVRTAAREQREALEWNSPNPSSLWSLVMSARLWERRVRDEDFIHVRIGAGTQRLAVQLIPPETKPVEDLEPMTSGALRRFVRSHSVVPQLPITVSLGTFARIAPVGDPDAVRGVVRSMIAQISAFHSPDDVRICVCASQERMPYWEWVKWLPHCMHQTEYDAAGQVRFMTRTLTELESLLGSEVKDRSRFTGGVSQQGMPYIFVVMDGGMVTPDSQIGADGIDGVCVIDVSGSVVATSDRTMLRLDVQPDRMQLLQRDRTGKDVPTPLGRPDTISVIQADGLARQLAPLRTSLATETEEQNALARSMTLTELLGISDPYAIDTQIVWRPRAPRNRLRVPIGVDAEGRSVELDIKEAAQGGFGPHGLVIGATGSGKSELLRTLVLGLASTHSSEILNFVLVDFKGGATFLGLDGLRHVSAIITNLEDELPLVDRMYDALHGEMVRRQEWLRAAGNYASLRDYERAREQGTSLTPMPTLFVVLDEFSELLSAKPEFAELFVMIGRLGRSLGVHLLLASQRLEEGKLRGLDTHLSYRIGLRTFSAGESRTVLGVPDAYELPQAPGNGYLKIGTESMTRFKAGYVSGVYQPEAEAEVDKGPRFVRQIVPFGPGYIEPKLAPETEVTRPTGDNVAQSEAKDEVTLFQIVVNKLRDQGPPAHEIWLPPLDSPATLDQLVPPLSVAPDLGLTTAGWEGRGRLHAAVGIVDKPFDQRRDPMWMDLSGATGHVGVAGSPQSGKSTLLRTLIASLALTHTPKEVQFYCLDFGGGTLSTLEGLPHVGGVAARLDGDRVRRTVAEVSSLLERRETFFSEHRIDSMSTFRRLRAAGQIPDDGFGDVFLVVDNWLTLRQDYEQLEGSITALAARGLGYGIHIVAATNKWSEFRASVRDLFGSRLELRLGDPYESDCSRRAAENVPEGRPGRGLTRDGYHFLAALPRIDGRETVEDMSEGANAFIEAVASAWKGSPAPRVRLLPDTVPASVMPGVEETGRRIPIGIDEDTLSPIYLDFDADPHFVIFGDTECGKTNLIHLISEAITKRYTPEEARLVFVDYRRGLIDAAGTEHRIGFAAASTAAASLMNDIREALEVRLPPADLSPDQLRTRSWWQGSDVFIIVDDYDLVATQSGNPLQPIAEFLPQARDIGLHLVMARAMGGAGRSLYDPIVQRLKEMASPSLMMSGNRDEGVLFGDVRPKPLVKGRGQFAERRRGTALVQTAIIGS